MNRDIEENKGYDVILKKCNEGTFRKINDHRYNDHYIDEKLYIKGDNFIIDWERGVVFYDNKDIKYIIDKTEYEKTGNIIEKGNSIEYKSGYIQEYHGNFFNGNQHDKGIISNFCYTDSDQTKLIETLEIISHHGIMTYNKHTLVDKKIVFEGNTDKMGHFTRLVKYINPKNQYPIALNMKGGNIIKPHGHSNSEHTIAISKNSNERRVHLSTSSPHTISYDINLHGSFYNKKSIIMLDDHNDEIFNFDSHTHNKSTDQVIKNIFLDFEKKYSDIKTVKKLRINLLVCKQKFNKKELEDIINSAPKNIDVVLEYSHDNNKIMLGSPRINYKLISSDFSGTTKLKIYNTNNKTKMNKDKNRYDINTTKNNRNYSLVKVDFNDRAIKMQDVMETRKIMVERIKESSGQARLLNRRPTMNIPHNNTTQDRQGRATNTTQDRQGRATTSVLRRNAREERSGNNGKLPPIRLC